MNNIPNMRKYAKNTPAIKSSRRIIKCSLAYIALITAMLLAIFPIFWVFSASINDTNTLLNTELKLIPDSITCKHYAKVIFGENSNFSVWFRNSSIVAVLTSLLSLIIGTTAGYAYSRYRFKGRKLTINTFLLLNAFPNILSIVAYLKILTTLKLINNLLGLVLIYTGGQLVFTVWNLKGYFDTIPYEIEEAAIIDGVSMSGIFLRIILPLSKPALAVTAIFSFLAGWNEYVIAATFTNNTDMFTLPVGLWSLQNMGNYAQDWPLFAAGSLIVAVPVMIVFIFLQKSLVSGLTLGSSK